MDPCSSWQREAPPVPTVRKDRWLPISRNSPTRSAAKACAWPVSSPSATTTRSPSRGTRLAPGGDLIDRAQEDVALSILHWHRHWQSGTQQPCAPDPAAVPRPDLLQWHLHPQLGALQPAPQSHGPPAPKRASPGSTPPQGKGPWRTRRRKYPPGLWPVPSPCTNSAGTPAEG